MGKLYEQYVTVLDRVLFLFSLSVHPPLIRSFVGEDRCVTNEKNVRVGSEAS